MVKLEEFNLALGVINNIIICDSDNKILFAGDEIKSILFHSDQFKIDLMENFVDPSVQERLLEKVAEARESKSTHHFEFTAMGESVFIFPANYNRSDCIVLSTKDQILLANKIENELQERVKELECLYSISNEMESASNLAEALKNSLNHLTNAFQFPSFTTACFQVDGMKFGNMECEASTDGKTFLCEDILVNDEIRGKIEICSHSGGEFMPEEIKLVKEVALMISKAIDKEETNKRLEQKRKLLISQNEDLTHMTNDLTDSNNKLKALFSAITDTIVVIDSKYNIIMSNKDSIGNHGKCFKKLFKSPEQCFNCPASRTFETGDSASVEKKIADEFFLLQSYPILNAAGEVDRVLEVCREITKEKHIEQQLIQNYKLASLGKLVAGIAHEINNPNTFIRGNINIINESFKDILPILDSAYERDDQMKIARLNYEIFKENIPILVEDMMGGADRIKKIVDGLRNFAKKDEGLLTDDVDINSVIQNNLRITEKQIRKQAKTQMRLDPAVPIFKGNISKLEQVMMNMMVNASHAIEHDKGLIIMETGHDKENNEVIIKIRDNGKGMDEKTKRHIFDPFYTTKRNRGGTGLGLSISFGIIQEHKGRIEVDSIINKGTTFTIHLPIKPPDSENGTVKS
ncbi:MAG: hypothetical protein GY757_50815 [bacterium]|nr:hypothetical protein [bacterium]